MSIRSAIVDHPKHICSKNLIYLQPLPNNLTALYFRRALYVEPPASSASPVGTEPPASSAPPVGTESPASSASPVGTEPPASSASPVGTEPPASSAPPVDTEPPASSLPAVDTSAIVELSTFTPSTKVKRRRCVSIEETVDELSNSVKNEHLDATVPTLPQSDDDLQKCIVAIENCDKSVFRSKQDYLLIAFTYGAWLIFTQTKLQNQAQGSLNFNRWMDENTAVKHSQGRVYMTFYRTFQEYPKIVQSTLSFRWFSSDLKTLVEYFTSHPNVGKMRK